MNLLFENLDNLTNFSSSPDINTSGIKRFGTSPLISASNMFYCRHYIKSPMKFISSNTILSDYIISASVNHSPDDWTGYDPKVKSLFSYLSKKYLEDLQNKKALLLLDSSFEGYQTWWLWDWFHKECSEFNISPSSIIYVTGNLIVEEVYNKWANENNINDRIFVVGYPHFEIDVAMNCINKIRQGNPLPTFNDHIIYKESNNIKTFSCLNKRIRPQRVWFYNYLYYSGLLDDGLVSMNCFPKHGYQWEGKVLSNNQIDEISELLPLLVHNKKNDEFDDSFYIKRFNPKICLDSYVSVVSEAHCGDSDQTLFLSEKTFKPIATQHPFIIMGNRGSIRKLNELGYKTFDNLIDQSYDGLPTHERLLYIIESIKKIREIDDKLGWFKELKNDIEHNYNLLKTRSTDNPPMAFTKVIEYYNNFFKINF